MCIIRNWPWVNKETIRYISNYIYKKVTSAVSVLHEHFIFLKSVYLSLQINWFFRSFSLRFRFYTTRTIFHAVFWYTRGGSLKRIFFFYFTLSSSSYVENCIVVHIHKLKCHLNLSFCALILCNSDTRNI